MENTSYALHIAIGVLIGIAMLSLLMFSWRRFGVFEKSKDDAQEVKNRSSFNAEYTAYDKPLMYGTDVLSCLNKAQNNNQKYVYSNYYGTETETIGKDDRTEYFIDVAVTLKSTLCDEVKAYYKDTKGKYQRVVGLGSTANYSDDRVFSNDGTKYTFDIPDIYYYYFKKGLVYQEKGKYTDIMWGNGSASSLDLGNVIKNGVPTSAGSGRIETLVKGTAAGTTYHLLEAEDWNSATTSPTSIKEAARLSALITTVGLKEQRIDNKNTPTSFNKDDWWYCTWTTAASDFKSRKFKCTNVEYNTDTGYITKICFEEI